MKKYQVYGHGTVVCGMTVMANSREEAIKKANKKFGGLTNYYGMGGTDCLIGVTSSASERSVFPDGEIEFDDCMEVS